MDKTPYTTPNVKVWIYNDHTSLCITGGFFNLTSAQHCTEKHCFSRK